MENSATKRAKLSTRINGYVASNTPIRKLAGNWSKKAQLALDEANSLSLERVTIKIKRLPRQLDGFRIQLSLYAKKVSASRRSRAHPLADGVAFCRIPPAVAPRCHTRAVRFVFGTDRRRFA